MVTTPEQLPTAPTPNGILPAVPLMLPNALPNAISIKGAKQLQHAERRELFRAFDRDRVERGIRQHIREQRAKMPLESVGVQVDAQGG